MSPYPFTNLEIEKYYQNEPKFNCVYARNNLPKIKNWAYIKYLHEYKWLRAHWIASMWIVIMAEHLMM